MWCVRWVDGGGEWSWGSRLLIEGCLNKRFVFLSSGWVGFSFRYGIVWHGLPMGLELVVYGNIWPARRLQVSFTMQICCYKIEECSSLLCLNKLCRLRR